MDINKLIEAVHELIDEIEGSDYVDMVHSDLRVNKVKELIGWPSKARIYKDSEPTWLNLKPMDGKIHIKNTGLSQVKEFDPFGVTLWDGSQYKPIQEANEKSITALPPTSWDISKPLSLNAGDSLIFKRTEKIFDVCTTTKTSKSTTITHNLGVEPYIIIGKDDNGWFSWKADCIGKPLIINSKVGGQQQFDYKDFDSVTATELVLDTSIFGGISYYYIFSKDGFQQFEDQHESP